MNETLWKHSGIQVVISAYNVEKYLIGCLLSVEESCKNHDWNLIFVDDGSTDHTFELAKDYIKNSSCQNHIITKYEKAKNVAQAKNRALKLTQKFKEKYPVICVMDADDEMIPTRIDYLLPKLLSDKGLFIVGDYIIYVKNLEPQYVDVNKDKQNLRFGIWATLFHQCLIPENGRFFDENIDIYSDFFKWRELKRKNNINFIFHSGQPVHRFFRRKDSVSGSVPEDYINKLIQRKINNKSV